MSFAAVQRTRSRSLLFSYVARGFDERKKVDLWRGFFPSFVMFPSVGLAVEVGRE
jgi:hypothetical protein